MKRTQIAIFLCVFLFGLGAFAFQQPAQDKDDHARMGQQNLDDRVKMMSEKLNLTDDQQTKLKSILTDQHQQMQTIMDDSSLSQDDKRAKMRGLRESTTSKIRDLLNDDQKKKFDEMQQEMRDRMRSKGGDAGQPK